MKSAERDALLQFLARQCGLSQNAAARMIAHEWSVGGSTGGGTGEIAGKRAGGGPVSAGKTYLVGERGPELFAAGTSGRINPNGGATTTGREIGGGKGAGPITITMGNIIVQGVQDAQAIA